MKIAVIIDTWFPIVGGGQTNAWEISKRLAKKQIHIDVITRNNGEGNLLQVKNLNIYQLGKKSDANSILSKIYFLPKAFLFIISKDYDIIHVHAFLPGIVARLLMVFKGIPTVLTVHGTSINTNLNNPLSKWFEKFILTQILYNAQITVSRDFLKLKNVNRNVVYIPNGVDTKKFDRVRTKKFGQPTPIFVGRLHPQKNLINLIEDISVVKKEIANIKLLIVGEGDLKAELQSQVANLKLKKNVLLLGQKKGLELIKLYKSSHLFILPSIYEGQPLTLLEAWAAKLPVIISNTGDNPYLVRNGQNGYLIGNIYDPNQIAKTIVQALAKDNLEKLGLNGYNSVKRFSWEKASKETLSIYEKVKKS